MTSEEEKQIYRTAGHGESTLPANITEIGNNAFTACSDVKRIVVDQDNPNYKSVGNCLLSKDGKILYSGCDNSIIPDGVTQIAGSAFYACNRLERIIIPDGVQKIGNYAFAECERLIGITVPDSVLTVGDSAFRNCRRLAVVTIGNNVTAIEGAAFYGCESLTGIAIPNSVEKIGYRAFFRCNRLERITIGGGVLSIGWEAFSACAAPAHLRYIKTRENWESVCKGSRRSAFPEHYTVHCSDGDLIR